MKHSKLLHNVKHKRNDTLLRNMIK